ncbi:MAG: GAF domain-containing protein, partial [Aggregatilineales bacterium]
MQKLDNKQHFMLKLGRVQILKELSLLDAPEESVYNQFTQLANEITGSSISLVTMIAGNRQFFKSATGLPEPLASERETPLSHSFCQHVVSSNEPLITSDARNDELLKDNLAIPDFNIIGYLGIPLKLFDERTLGSFCAVDHEP